MSDEFSPGKKVKLKFLRSGTSIVIEITPRLSNGGDNNNLSPNGTETQSAFVLRPSELQLPAGESLFEISQVDEKPVPKFRALPTYPFEMKRAGISGEVLVDLIVDIDGKVRNAFSAHSSRIEFEASAIEAVNKWTFRPGRRHGHSVYTHMQVPIVFNLN